MLHFVKAVYQRRSDYDNNRVSCDDGYYDRCGNDEGVISREELTFVSSTALCVCLCVSYPLKIIVNLSQD